MKRAIKTTALLVALAATHFALAAPTLNTDSTSTSNSGTNANSVSNNLGLASHTTSNSSSTPATSSSGSGSSSSTTGNAQSTTFDVTPEVTTSTASKSTVLVNRTGNFAVRTNPAIFAPALVTTLNDTCMGSSSFGLSIPGYGLSAGKTIVNDECVRRLDAREFRALGMNDVAMALLCQSPANQKAANAAGYECAGLPRKP